MRFLVPAELLMLATVVIWGLGFPIGKYALTNGFDPLVFAATRFVVAAAAFSAVAVRREGSLRVRRRDFPLILAAAAVGIWINQLTYTYALHETSAATVALTFGTLPVFVALFAHFGRVERVGRRTWIAGCVSVVGVALVATGAGGRLSGDVVGILLAIGATSSLAAYSVVVGPLLTRYSPYRLNSNLAIVGAVLLVAVASGRFGEENWGDLSALTWGAFLYAALPAYVLSNILWLTVIDRIGAPRASLYANLSPFAGVLFALLLLSERLTPLQLLGGATIAAAIVLARPRRFRIAPAE
jgi:drug/metabolite transporter (DMT)-like permease